LVSRFHVPSDRPLWVIERASLTTTTGQILSGSRRMRDWVPDTAGAGGFAVAEEGVGRVEFDSACDWTDTAVRHRLCADTGWRTPYTWMDGGRWNPVVGASRTWGVLHAWNGSDSVLREQAGVVSTVRAPQGISVVLAERVAARVFDPGAAPDETRLVLADVHGGLWVEGEEPVAAAARPEPGPSVSVSVHHAGLRLHMPRAGRVQVQVVAADGRAAPVVFDRNLSEGIHDAELEHGGAGIAVVRLDGRVVGRAVLLPRR
jgi:hypothetical protein